MTPTLSSTSSGTTKESVRYQRLLECIPMALDKCHHKVDVEHAIRLCYGGNERTSKSDAVDTGASDNDIFCSMLRDNILQQQFHNEVVNSTIEFLQEQRVEEKLCRLEAIIRRVDYGIDQNKKAIRKDKESAMKALQQAKSSVSPSDIIQYKAFQHLLTKKKLMENEIQQMEMQVQQLQNERQTHLQQHNDQTTTMTTTVQMELEQAADLCSLIQ